MSRMLKAVNTAANRIGFSLVVTLNEKQISDCIILLEKEYSVTVGYVKDNSLRSSSKLYHRSYIIMMHVS